MYLTFSRVGAANPGRQWEELQKGVCESLRVSWMFFLGRRDVGLHLFRERGLAFVWLWLCKVWEGGIVIPAIGLFCL